MKKTLTIVFFVATLVPSILFAASIKSTTEASSDTGGNSAEGGVVTTGASSASVETHTIVSGQKNGSSTVEIKVETEVNGVKHTESVEKEVAEGEDVVIRVGTSTGMDGAKGEVKAEVLLGEATSGSATSTSKSWTSILFRPQTFSTFFKSIFSFFGFL